MYRLERYSGGSESLLSFFQQEAKSQSTTRKSRGVGRHSGEASRLLAHLQDIKRTNDDRNRAVEPRPEHRALGERRVRVWRHSRRGDDRAVPGARRDLGAHPPQAAQEQEPERAADTLLPRILVVDVALPHGDGAVGVFIGTIDVQAALWRDVPVCDAALPARVGGDAELVGRRAREDEGVWTPAVGPIDQGAHLQAQRESLSEDFIIKSRKEASSV